MMEAVKAMLIDLGVPKENIKIEAFGGAKPKTSSENKPNTPRINSEEKAKTENNVNVSFTLSNKVVLSTPEKTILEAAEVLDIEIDNSCRAGSCGMCKVKLLSGEVSMEIEDSLEAEEKEQGII
jgi:ferredoxin